MSRAASVKRLVLVYGEKNDGTDGSISIDEHCGLHTINHVHALLHLGKIFVAGALWPATLNSNDTLELLFVSGNKAAHIVSEVVGDGAYNVELFEGATTSNDGASVTIFNKNRDSANTAVATVFQVPTVTVDGTALPPIHSPGSNQFGMVTRDSEEWKLSPSTKYLLRITSKSASNEGSYRWLWYEDE